MNYGSQKRRFRIYTYRLIVLFLVLFTLLGLEQTLLAADTIKIGVVDAFSGDFKSAGEGYFAAVEQAVWEVNQAGGLLGKKIELFKGDSMYKADVATRAAQKLFLDEKVDFLIQGGSSAISLALQKVAEEHNKLYFNVGAGADAITGKEFTKYTFRMTFCNTSVVTPMARYVASQPITKVYQLHWDNTFGHDQAVVFSKKLMQLAPKAKILGEDFTPMGTKNFAPYIKKIQASGAEFVYNTLGFADMVTFTKQAREMGLTQNIINGVGLFDPIVSEQLGDSLEHSTMITAFGGATVDTPAQKAFNKRYRDRHPDAPLLIQHLDTVYLWAYNGVRFALAAVQKAGSTDTEKVIAALEGMEYDYTFGKVKMRACDHNLLMPMHLFKVVPVPPKDRLFSVPYYLSKPIATYAAEECTIPATPDYNPRCK